MTTDDDKTQKWVLEVHNGVDAALSAAMQADGHVEIAESDSGLWWAVLNVEGADFEPESMWPTEAMAQERADYLNKGRYPSWWAMPAVVAWWMRNETPPEETT